MGQNVWRNLIGPLKSGIITNLEDNSDTMSDTELETNISPLFFLEDHSPSSPLLLEQEQQEVAGEDVREK